MISFFLSWKNYRRWWKSILQWAIFPQASGRYPKPCLLPSARPRKLFWELDPICRGSSAPITPSQDDILYASMVSWCKFPPDRWSLSTETESTISLVGLTCTVAKTGIVFNKTCDIVTSGLRKAPHLCTTKLGHMFDQTMPLQKQVSMTSTLCTIVSWVGTIE